MKKSILYIFLILACLTFVCATFCSRTHTKQAKRVEARGYNRKCQVFREIPLTDSNKKEILFIGHSLVNEFLVDEFMSHGEEITYVNMGIGGDDCQGMYARRELAFGRFPYKMVVEIGINDVLNEEPIDTIINYYTQFIQEAISREIQVIVCSVIPSMAQYKDEISELNTRLQEYCISLNCVFIDLSEMGDQDGSLLSEYDCGDHIHLSGKGYLFWSNKLKPYLYD